MAKIKSQIRSVFDWELMVIADVLGVDLADFAMSRRALKKELPELIDGKKG